MGNNNRFFDGLLWGILVGGGAVFLLGTKTGNKLLKIITEEGAESLNEVVSKIEDEIADFQEDNVSEVKADDHKPSNFEKELSTHLEEVKEDLKPKVKRFFRSSKKSL